MAAGATIQQLESSQAFRDALFQFASQDAVRNKIWKACTSSIDD